MLLNNNIITQKTGNRNIAKTAKTAIIYKNHKKL